MTAQLTGWLETRRVGPSYFMLYVWWGIIGEAE